jgi:hypothetical protein
MSSSACKRAHAIRRGAIPGFIRRTSVLVGLLVAAGAAVSGVSEAQDRRPLPAAAVRAGFLLNFLRFTEWPDSVFADDLAPVVVTICGDSELVETLRAIVPNERVGAKQRLISVVDVDDATSNGRTPDAETQRTRLRSSHMAYFGSIPRTQAQAWLRQCRDRPVLTVSERARFTQDGGMIELVVRNGRMTFDVVPDRIRDAGITLSSKVLRLGRNVEAGPL